MALLLMRAILAADVARACDGDWARNRDVQPVLWVRFRAICQASKVDGLRKPNQHSYHSSEGRFMTIRPFLSAFGLTLLLLSKPSLAETYGDGSAAYSRGDYAAALQIWKSLADHGSQSAQYGLGELYSLGHGVSRDDREAAKWYERAASSGHVRAQSRLAAMYDEGRGVPRSLSKAMKWYRKAAQQGDPSAQLALGLIYGTGRGVPQNYLQAVKWYLLAAEQGNALAQNNLGLIYAGGYDAVPKDDVQALVWFNLAAKGGNGDARKNRQAFIAHMSAEQVEQAEKLAHDWMAAKAQDKAAKCLNLEPPTC
jgi:TPR repeat protein